MAVLVSEGTTFEVQEAGGSWSALCVTDLTGLGGGQAAVIDKTTLCSSAKEKAMGLPDEGQISVTVFYDPANAGHVRMQYLRDNQAQGAFRVTLTDSGTEVWTFSGYVLAAELGVGIDQLVTMVFTVEVDGAITRA